GPSGPLAEELDGVAPDELLVEVRGRQDGAPVNDPRESYPDRAPPSEVRRDHPRRIGHLRRRQQEGRLDLEAAGKEAPGPRLDRRAFYRCPADVDSKHLHGMAHKISLAVP